MTAAGRGRRRRPRKRAAQEAGASRRGPHCQRVGRAPHLEGKDADDDGTMLALPPGALTEASVRYAATGAQNFDPVKIPSRSTIARRAGPGPRCPRQRGGGARRPRGRGRLATVSEGRAEAVSRPPIAQGVMYGDGVERGRRALSPAVVIQNQPLDHERPRAMSAGAVAPTPARSLVSGARVRERHPLAHIKDAARLRRRADDRRSVRSPASRGMRRAGSQALAARTRDLRELRCAADPRSARCCRTPSPSSRDKAARRSARCARARGWQSRRPG